MIAHSVSNSQVVFKVQVVPRSSRSEVVGEHNGALRIRIAAPPVDGAANEELVRVLAKTFKLSRSAIRIVSGVGARTKQISVDGSADEIVALLESFS